MRCGFGEMLGEPESRSRCQLRCADLLLEGDATAEQIVGGSTVALQRGQPRQRTVGRLVADEAHGGDQQLARERLEQSGDRGRVRFRSCAHTEFGKVDQHRRPLRRLQSGLCEVVPRTVVEHDSSCLRVVVELDARQQCAQVDGRPWDLHPLPYQVRGDAEFVPSNVSTWLVGRRSTAPRSGARTT